MTGLREPQEQTKSRRAIQKVSARTAAKQFLPMLRKETNAKTAVTFSIWKPPSTTIKPRNIMILKNLTIRKIESWEGLNKGQFEAKMEWEDDKSQRVSVILDSEVSKALLKFCAPLLTRFAAASARQIELSALEAIADSEKPVLPMESAS